jgi:dipeptidyl aminopeptidase/acylaminoacyl peptidase
VVVAAQRPPPPLAARPRRRRAGAGHEGRIRRAAAARRVAGRQDRLVPGSGEDPRQLHLFAAKIDGTEVTQVTRERGTHRAELSPDQQWAHVVWSNLETRPSARLLELATNTSTPLPQPPDPLSAFALPQQRPFQIKAEDDTVLYGHLALPPNLAEGQKCPVLLYVYGGPHVQLVTDQWLGGAPLWLQSFAAEGYVVCWLDNRGTPNRGIAFEQVLYRRLGVLEVRDQLRAVEWLQQQPFVDGSRIGVHGWSYGGYLTLRLMLTAPTTFACGVSGAPVTDWAMYETGYTERYMDSPSENAAGYRDSSCLPLVEKLERPLLLVQGTDDRTVMWAHSLVFVERCIETGKQIDYFPIRRRSTAWSARTACTSCSACTRSSRGTCGPATNPPTSELRTRAVLSKGPSGPRNCPRPEASPRRSVKRSTRLHDVDAGLAPLVRTRCNQPRQAKTYLLTSFRRNHA